MLISTLFTIRVDKQPFLLSAAFTSLVSKFFVKKLALLLITSILVGKLVAKIGMNCFTIVSLVAVSKQRVMSTNVLNRHFIFVSYILLTQCVFFAHSTISFVGDPSSRNVQPEYSKRSQKPSMSASTFTPWLSIASTSLVTVTDWFI